MEDEEIKTGLNESVGVATVSRNGGRDKAKAIEDAMVKAILDANKEGISSSDENSVEIRKRMMDARQRAIADWDAQQAADLAGTPPEVEVKEDEQP